MAIARSPFCRRIFVRGRCNRSRANLNARTVESRASGFFGIRATYDVISGNNDRAEYLQRVLAKRRRRQLRTLCLSVYANENRQQLSASGSDK
jgi:hypothetical protein